MERHIKNVYVGLPAHLADSVLWVAREYRRNPLSFTPGGSDVVVEYHEGNVFGYDWIKFPSSYISTIFIESIISEYENYDSLTELVQLGIVKSKYYRIYARKYEDEKEYLIVPFQEVWNSLTATTLPWEVLEEFDAYKRNHSKPANKNKSEGGLDKFLRAELEQMGDRGYYDPDVNDYTPNYFPASEKRKSIPNQNDHDDLPF